MKKLTFVLTSLISAISFSSLYAQDGVLDASFGNNGIVVNSSELGGNGIVSLGFQTDGKIISGENIVYQFVGNGVGQIARYNTNGTLDTSFGNNGVVIKDFGDDTSILDLIVLEDNKIVITGTAALYDGYVAKYNADGTPDTSFGDNGTVILTQSSGRSLLVQPDGKIVIGGCLLNEAGSDNGFAVFRFNTNGSPDIDFGNNGSTITNISGAIWTIELAEDNKIVAGGSHHSSIQRPALLKYTNDGQLDLSFGINGMILHGENTSHERISELTVTPDNKIIAAISTYTTDMKVYKYNTDGTPDVTFGSNGICTITFGNSLSSLSALIIQENGKIIVGGHSHETSDPYQPTLARINTNGSIDSSFGNNGHIIISNGTSDLDYGIIHTINIKENTLFCGGYGWNSFLMKFLINPNLGVVNFTTNNTTFVYPNPLDETSVLEYTLANDEQISIMLTDIQGKVIKTYANNIMQAVGNYKLPLSIPSDLASGTYMLTLSSAKGKATVKVIK